jgi:hypothetical protein
MDKRIVITALISAIGGGAIGGAVTYLTVKKTFAERAQRDIDDVKQAYHDRFEGKRVVNVYGPMPGEDGNVVVPGSTISAEDYQQAKEFVERLNYQSVADEDNAFVQDTKVSIYDRQEKPVAEEVESKLLIGYDRDALKKAHKPYLISLEEFNTTETEWDKESITYYEDDDTLTDENNMPIADVEYLIGEKHLDFFGIRSGDKNQVFVRNPNISTDYEVTRNMGSYTELVLGVIKGADKLGVRKMRDGDDG